MRVIIRLLQAPIISFIFSRKSEGSPDGQRTSFILRSEINAALAGLLDLLLGLLLDGGAEGSVGLVPRSRAGHPRAGWRLDAWRAVALVAAVSDSHGALHALAAQLQATENAFAGLLQLQLVHQLHSSAEGLVRGGFGSATGLLGASQSRGTGRADASVAAIGQ